jgi:hypothetical protein
LTRLNISEVLGDVVVRNAEGDVNFTLCIYLTFLPFYDGVFGLNILFS